MNYRCKLCINYIRNLFMERITMFVPSPLPDAEYEIMLIIWDQPAPITSMQVAALAGPLKNWKAQTVLTLIGRLTKRGYLASEKRGKELYHTPLVSKDEYIRAETGSFMKKFHGNSLKGLVSALYSEDSPDEKTLSELDEWLKDKEGKE